MPEVFVMIPPGASGATETYAKGFTGDGCKVFTAPILAAIGGSIESDTPAPSSTVDQVVTQSAQ